MNIFWKLWKPDECEELAIFEFDAYRMACMKRGWGFNVSFASKYWGSLSISFVTNTKYYLEATHNYLPDCYYDVGGALFWKPFQIHRYCLAAKKTFPFQRWASEAREYLGSFEEPKSGLSDDLVDPFRLSGLLDREELKPGNDSKEENVAGKIKNQRKRSKRKNVEKRKKLSNRPKIK